jgi:hypothetical protein
MYADLIVVARLVRAVHGSTTSNRADEKWITRMNRG